MRRARLPLLLCLAACSDYELAGKGRPSDGGAVDTGAPVPVDTAPPLDTGDPPPPACPDAPPAPREPTVDEACADEPVLGSFSPEVEARWTDNPVHPGYQQIMAAPAVAPLTDDDGDGDVDGDDVPDIIFTAFSGSAYRSPGALVALSGDDLRTHWSRTDWTTGAGVVRPYGTSGVAVGDVDGTGPSIFVFVEGGLARVAADGSLVWTVALPTMPGSPGAGQPALGDVDGDGVAEIAAGPHLVSADGRLLWSGAGGSGMFASVLIDLDGDGPMELVAGNTVYEADGRVRFTFGEDGMCAVADLDQDGVPEVITAEWTAGHLNAVSADGLPLWQITLDDRGGGAPTVADFDGDGAPEVGLASERWYRVIEAEGVERWRMPVQDASSQRTGSAVFDFDGDGAAEVVYADEETLWAYDGPTGGVELEWAGHSSGTLWENPLVVDVDGDGASEIVLATNDYSSYRDSRGIVVLGDPDGAWSAARRVWNQHAYHIDHVDDAGRVPAAPALSWATHNSFRAGNSELRVGLALADLAPQGPELCLDECGAGVAVAWLSVESRGPAGAGASRVAMVRQDSFGDAILDLIPTPALPSGGQVWLGPLRLTAADFGDRGLRFEVDAAAEVEECAEGGAVELPTFPCGG